MFYTNLLSNYGPWATLILLVIVAWSIVWKGIALWKAAKNSDKAWFIVLLIINTVGILEIFYIYVFSKRESNKQIKKEK